MWLVIQPRKTTREKEPEILAAGSLVRQEGQLGAQVHLGPAEGEDASPLWQVRWELAGADSSLHVAMNVASLNMLERFGTFEPQALRSVCRIL